MSAPVHPRNSAEFSTKLVFTAWLRDVILFLSQR